MNLLRFILIILLTQNVCFSQKQSNFYDFSQNSNNSFNLNEELYYKFSYGKSNKKGFLTGGYGSLKIMGVVKKDEFIAYQIEAKGKTTKIFSLFYKVQDYFTSYMDTSSLLSLEFRRFIQEGKYKKNQIAYFDRNSNKATTQNKKIDITNYTQDVISALYACRTIPNEEIIINDTIFIQIYNLEKKKMFNTYFVPIKKEKIKTALFGEINTIKCHPHVQKNRIFSDKDETYIWVTDDQYHVPVKVETPIQVGSIYIEIIDAENINYKF